MIIPGYLDGYEPPFVQSPLVDGSDMMEVELFWPTFLHTVGGSASAPHAFNADPADLNDVIDAFLDKHAWPVFSLRLSAVGRVHVVMRNFPDEGGIDYVLNPGRGGDVISLAAMDGHFRGPALAWSELITVAHQPDPNHTPAERLLLLLPACADRDRPTDANQTVAEALTAIGATSHTGKVSEELLNSPRYWARDCAWTIVGGALICRGSHTYRSPDGGLTPTDLRLITDAFGRRPASDV